MTPRSIEILLVEDNPGDILLTQTAFQRSKIANHLICIDTAEEALQYLRQQAPHEQAGRPDLILLDLNLPKMTGTELLRVIKKDPCLRTVPVVILTSSDADVDVSASYHEHANSYITKPISPDDFIAVVNSIEDFWFAVVKLPVTGEH